MADIVVPPDPVVTPNPVVTPMTFAALYTQYKTLSKLVMAARKTAVVARRLVDQHG